MTEQVKKLMDLLEISEEEALQVIADDKAIDRGERMPFDLSKEEEKQAKKYANVSEKTKKTVKKTPKRAENTTKSAIIAQLFDFLTDKNYNFVEIVNKERQIKFKVGENDYELTLIQKRKPKK